MSRLEELKARGLKNLKGADRAEYLALSKELKAQEVDPAQKAQFNNSVPAQDTHVDTTTPAATIKTKMVENITMTKEELTALIQAEVQKTKDSMPSQEGMEEALKFGRWVKSHEPKKANSMASLRVYRADGLAEGGIIIDWKFVKNAFNEESRLWNIPMYQITVLYDSGEQKKYEIPLLQMVQINEFEKVEIIKQDVVEQKRSTGKGQKPHTNNGYSFSNPAMFGTKQMTPGEEFDYIETRKDITCTIKRPNGSILTIHSDRLNQ